jgi:hypothetical protein
MTAKPLLTNIYGFFEFSIKSDNLFKLNNYPKKLYREVNYNSCFLNDQTIINHQKRT